MATINEVVSRIITPYKKIIISIIVFILFAVFGYYLYTQYGSPVVEKKNAEISNNVVTEYVDRTNTIREKEYVYLDAAKNTVPSQHVMSNGWVYTHDISATSGDADSARASDASPSGITDTTALLAIIGNYSRCQANAEQLRQLQQWIIQNKEAVDAMAKEKKK